MTPAYPKIIYGTAWKEAKTTDLVVAAIKQGFRAIDTAGQPKHYKEDLVGAALQKAYKEGFKREDLYIQTKFTPLGGHDLSKPIPYSKDASVSHQVAQSFAASTRNLHTSIFDAYLLHGPYPTLAQTLEAWHALAELRTAGQVRLIGVSNVYDVATLKALHEDSGEKVDIVQNRWYEGNKWSHDVWQYCLEHGIIFQSFWTLHSSPSLLSHPAVDKLAQIKGCTPQQVVFKLAQTSGVVPLAGSTSAEHMRDGLEVETLDFSDDESVGLLEQLRRFIVSGGVDDA
ncbi:Aldo/keto reductase [Auricularia subglabra TFB-10046 SS5]|nr:Aldo/keto reductase [Auricularia subglabra TFB-10046 SS5]